MDDCTLENVSILTDKNAGAPFLVNVGEEPAEMPATVTISYFAEYTVTFDTDGGNEIAPVTITEGRTVAEQIPEKYTDEFDYEFLGWYNGETKWDFSTPVTADMTLVARWNEVEKTNVLLDASKQTLSKWDYGTEFTAETETDEYYGNLWKITLSGDGAEHSFQHSAISTKDYTKVYFYVYNSLEKAVRLTLHGGYDEGWGLVTMNLVTGWNLVGVDVSVFATANEGQIFLVIQEIDGLSIAGEWKISSFYGLKDGETAPEVQQPVQPEPEPEPETNVLLDASTQTIEKSCSYGGDITVVSATDATFGPIWNITVGDVKEQGFHHAAIDTKDFVKVYFYIFNPLAQEVRMQIHGGWNAWAVATFNLQAGWNLVELDVSVFTEDVAGQIFPVIQDPHAVSVAGEWKISSFYGLKDGETAPEVQQPVQPEPEPEPETNVLLDASTQTIEKSCSYGGDITVVSATDATFGPIWNITVGDVKEQGFHHAAIDTKDFVKVYFYIFNPLAQEVRMQIHGGWNAWAVATFNLQAGWNLVELDVSVFTEDVAGQIFPVIQDPHAVSVAGEWKISSFYGLKDGETAPEVQQPVQPEPEPEPETNVLLDASKQTLSKWDYGMEFTAVAGTDETYGNLWTITLPGTAGPEQGIQHPAINTKDYAKVYFYVYNPLAQEVRLNIHTPNTWGKATIILVSGWNLVELDAATFNDGAVGQINFIIQEINALSLAGEWKITSFYGA